MVLAVTRGLTMNDDLVLGINEGLAIISLDGAVGGHHHGRVIVRHITPFFSTSRTQLGLILGQPCIDLLGLLLQFLHQLLAAGARSPGDGRILPSVGLYLLF